MRTDKAITQIPAAFAYQSYFDNALLQNAILDQMPGASIVDSTLQTADVEGVGVGLHPCSASPVAIRFKGGDSDSAEVILTPGQVVDVGEFSSFEWGLPFGWLGGGTSVLYVKHRPEARILFPDTAPEVAFHRTRMVIDGDFTGALRQNWPGTFPWQAAVSANAVPQQGAPIISIEPGAVLFRLRVAMTTPATLYLRFRGIDEFDVDVTGALGTTDETVIPLAFNGVPSGFPLAWIQPEIARLVSSAGGLNIVDDANTNALSGSFIDVVRYGRMG